MRFQELIPTSRNIVTRIIVVLLLFCAVLQELRAQCCSGGSGSPIAGGGSQGVLCGKQAELNFSYQNVNSGKTITASPEVPPSIQHYYSQYLYGRAAYGVTPKLTFSVEMGYFLNKTQYGLNLSDTMSSGGFADLLVFPRYTLFSKGNEKSKTEFTIGLGCKIPLGTTSDSVKYFTHPVTGEEYYTRKPLNVQTTSGSNDFILYGFFYHGFPAKNFRLFSTLYYIRKGWNNEGEKFGDYASLGLFAGKTLLKKGAFTVQFKAEWLDKIRRAPGLPFPNYDPASTGSFKVFFVPQLNYTFKESLTFYVLEELPLYQHVNGSQIGSRFQTTFGVTWRFYISKLEK